VGVRILCRLESEAVDRVVYSIEIRASEVLRGSAAVSRETGEVAFGPWSPAEPPAETTTLARAFLRAAWSSTRKKDPEPWPRKLDRWRPELG